MMPVVRIPDPVFERLQTIATPFVDTPGSVIERLLDFYESHHKTSLNQPADTPQQKPTLVHAEEFDSDSPPDLVHTKVLAASFGDEPAGNWNELVSVAHRTALKRLKTFDAVRAATMSNIASGRRTDSGFRYYSEMNISIQNVDSKLSWRNALHLARRLSMPVQVEFEWRQKSGAAHPGKRGLIRWSPA